MTHYYWADSKTQKKKEQEEAEEKQPQIFIVNDGPSGPAGGSAVDSHDNCIMFYGEVNGDNAKLLNKALRTMDKDLQVVKVKYGVQVPIKLYINSYGGSIFAGFSTVDTIKSLSTPVHTYIDGSAASAATLISVVADKRFIHQNSFMLIHQLSSVMWGKYEEFKDEMENLDMLMSRIKDIYKEHCSIPKKELDEILKHDLWLDSAKCVKWGLVDGIV
jgi:ATP-dependent Clp protease protease subunit